MKCACAKSYQRVVCFALIITTLHMSNNVQLVYVIVIIFTLITIIIQQNFTGEILICFIQPPQTSSDFSSGLLGAIEKLSISE